jgi:hypothetical protein
MPATPSENKCGSQTGDTATDDHYINIARAPNRHEDLQQQGTNTTTARPLAEGSVTPVRGAALAPPPSQSLNNE